MDNLIQWLMDPSPFLLSVFWVLMLADCMTNKALGGGQRTRWVVMIFVTHGFGALIYLCCGKSYLFAKLVNAVRKQSKVISRSPQQSQRASGATVPQPHSDYQQGYRAQEHVATIYHEPEQQYYDASFEQPQASYPEMRLPIQR